MLLKTATVFSLLHLLGSAHIYASAKPSFHSSSLSGRSFIDNARGHVETDDSRCNHIDEVGWWKATFADPYTPAPARLMNGSEQGKIIFGGDLKYTLSCAMCRGAQEAGVELIRTAVDLFCSGDGDVKFEVWNNEDYDWKTNKPKEGKKAQRTVSCSLSSHKNER
jgi:hypothetical protein